MYLLLKLTSFKLRVLSVLVFMVISNPWVTGQIREVMR